MPAEILDLARPDSVCARFIDPYGDTVFNQLQLPPLIDELSAMARSASSAELRRRLRSVVEFLEASKGMHVYVRFIGD